MTDIISLDAERQRRDGPDAENIQIIDGEHWFKFTCSFDYADREYCFEIWARDFEDAQARIDALQKTARVDGKLYTNIEH